MSNHYTYRAEWSPEDDEFVGLVAEFPSLSWLAPTAGEAVEGASKLVDDILLDMAESGETPPVPFSERRYSGNLTIRTSPAQHRALTIEAAEQGVSVNQWANHKLGVVAAQPTQSAPPRVNWSPPAAVTEALAQFAAYSISPQLTSAVRDAFDSAALKPVFVDSNTLAALAATSVDYDSLRDALEAAAADYRTRQVAQDAEDGSMVTTPGDGR